MSKATRAGLWDWDMINNRVIFSQTWKNMLGYSDSEVENSFEGWKKLWHPEDVSEIKVQEYLTDLLESIFESFSRQKVSIEVSAGDILLSTKTAVPLGLIVNELATNALKYGFTAGGSPCFSAHMRADREQEGLESPTPRRAAASLPPGSVSP